MKPSFDIFGNLIRTPIAPLDKEDLEDHPTHHTRGDYLRSREDEDHQDNKENLIPYTKERIFTPMKHKTANKLTTRSPFLDITPPAAKKKGEKGSSGRKGVIPNELHVSPEHGSPNGKITQFR